MRRLAVAAALVSALIAPVASHAATPAPAPRHNVVVIMSDDQDFRSMSAMPQTQRLIADTGTTFEQEMTSYPLCCPSRATFFTGEYAHNHGVKWNFFPQGGYYVFQQKEVMPLWLQRAGYRTIHIGKYLNETGERHPTEIPNGWTDYDGGVDPSTYDYYGMTLNHNGHLHTYPRTPENYSTDLYTRLALQQIDASVKLGKPFFLNLAPNAPHTVSAASNAEKEGTPAVPPPRYADLYASAPLPDWPDFNEADVSDKPPLLQAAFPLLTDPQIASLTAHYRGRMGAVRGVDDMVAAVIARLRKRGILATTDVIFTSDNGWMLGEHRLVDKQTITGDVAGVKYFPYEGSARVPLLATGPDFPRHRTVAGVTVNADLAPTIEQIAGATPKLPQDGRSLLPAAQRPSLLDGRGVLLEAFANPRGAPPYSSIRTARYRYDLEDDGVEQLYDLQLDPWELESKHDDPAYAKIKAILAAKLAVLRTCRGANCEVDVGVLPEPAPPR